MTSLKLRGGDLLRGRLLWLLRLFLPWLSWRDLCDLDLERDLDLRFLLRSLLCDLLERPCLDRERLCKGNGP